MNPLFLLAAAIFFITLAISLKKLSLGFLFFIVLSPLMHKELFSLGVWDLLPVRMASIGLATAAFIHFINWSRYVKSRNRSNEIKKFIFKDPFLTILLLLWTARALSIFKSSEPEYSIKLFGFYSSVVLVYMVFKSLLTRYGEEFYEKVIQLYLTIGFFVGIFAVIQYYLRLCCRKTIGGVWVVPGFNPRLGATFWDVNHYGGFLVTLIPLYFAYIFASKSRYRKILYALGIVFSAFLLFMTQSRSSWIGLAVGVAISAIVFYGNKLKRPIMLSLIIAGVGIILIFMYSAVSGISLRDKAARFMHYRLDSTDTHMMLLEGAAEVFLNNLAIGSGYGNFDQAFRATETASDYFDREPKLREMKIPPHSIWGEVLAETGGVGIVLYSLFVISLLGSVIAAVYQSEDKRTKYLGIGVLGSVTSIFTAGLFYSYNMEFYWITIFIAVGYLFSIFKNKWSFSSILKWWYDKRITPYLVIVPPAVFYIFLKLGSTTLIDWDEAIYAKVAKNIVTTGDWLSLRWDNMEKYWFEKPPLYMWLTALVFKVTNFNSLGARLTSAVFGFFGVILTYKFGEKLYNKLVGVFSALILLSTVHYLYYSRNGMLDVTVTFFTTATLCLFYLGMKKSNTARHSSSYFVLAGITLGLGVMTKAVIGLLPIPIITIFILYLIFIQKVKLKADIGKNLLAGIGAFLVVFLPWHVYSIIIHGNEFIDKYLIDHIIGRGLSGFGHEKPVWWFLEVIKVSFRIWIFPLLGGVLLLPVIDRTKRSEYMYLSISALLVLVFFSVSKDKLQWYIMPIYPILALMSARFMERALVYANSLLRKDIKLDIEVIRSSSVLVTFIIAIFYILIMRDRIYFPDFNRDKVALVKIHNELYPIEDYPDKKLYYRKISPPVLLFYSDHRIKSTSEEHMLRTIDEAAPNQNYSFLIPSGMYYSVRDDQDKIKAPLVLDVKGAAGSWILVKSKSRVELLNEEFNNLTLSMKPLENKELSGTITDVEKEQLTALQKRFDEVVAQLTQYGYPPF